MLGEPLLGHDGEAPDVGLVSGHHLGKRYQLRLPSEHYTAGMYVNMLSAVQGNVVPLGAQLCNVHEQPSRVSREEPAA